MKKYAPAARQILWLSAFVGMTLTAFAQSKTPTKIGLREALAQKLVRAELVGLGGFNKACVELKLVNTTKHSLTVELESGEFLQPDNDGEQRLLVGNTVLLAMAAKQSASSAVYGFCSQQHKSSPSKQTTFRATGRAPQALYDLAKLIEKNQFFSSAAQEAVWCISDNANIEWLLSDNNNEEKLLREYVAAVRHIDLTKLPKIKRTVHIYNQVGQQQKTIKLDRDHIDATNGEAGKKIADREQKRTVEAAAEYQKEKEMAAWTVDEISGKIAVNLSEPALLTIDIIDPQGKVLTQVYKSQDVVQGKATIPYKYQQYHLPKGSYKIRASGNGTVLKEEAYELK